MNGIKNFLPSVNVFSILAIFLGTWSLMWAQWENPLVDSITNTQIRKETMLQSLCIDDSGMVHLVWKHQRTPGWRIFYCTNSPNGTWSAPQEVADSMQANFDPAIAWWSQGEVPFVVYEQNSEICSAYLSGGLWQTYPVTINAQFDRSPSLAIDGWGLPHAAWITVDTATAQYKIAYATGYLVGPNISWSVQTLAGSELGPYGSGASPFIAVTADGVAHIVYRGGDYGNYHIHHAWNEAQGGIDWQYEILYSGNANDYSASMVIEDNGNYHLAVSGNDGWGFPGRVYYFRKPFGQAWQQYELASLGGSAAEPSLAVDYYGAPHIVWMETSGNFYTGNVYYSGKDSTGAWQASLVIGGDHFSPSLQVDQQGYGHVACHTGGNTSVYDIYHVKSSSVLTNVDEFENPIIGSGSAYLLRNYPNPVRTHTEVFYVLKYPGHVTLRIYNSIGEEVTTLVDETKLSGMHSVVWRPQDLSAGIYFFHLISNRSEKNRKCILLP